MATEDNRLAVMVIDRSSSASNKFNSPTLIEPAFQFAYDTALYEIGQFQFTTTQSAYDTLTDLWAATGTVEQENAEVHVIEAEVPLASTVGNATIERTLAKGIIHDIDITATAARWSCGDWFSLLEEAEPVTLPSGDIDSDIASQSVLSLTGGDPQTGSLSREIPHRTAHAYIRDACQHGGFVPRVNLGQTAPSYELETVTDGIGTDRGVELSPSNGNVSGSPTVDRGNRDATHLAVIGADDPNTADGRYVKQAALSHAAAGDWREIWHVEDDPGLTTQTEVDNKWDEIAADIENSDTRKDIELTAVGIDHVPRLGDQYDIDIDQLTVTASNPSNDPPNFRVVERGIRLDDGEERYPLTISNRAIARPQRERDETVEMQQLRGNLGS